LVILLIIFSNSIVFAASASGPKGYIYNVYGYSYYMQNTVECAYWAEAETLMHTLYYATVPAGYIGVKARLYDDDGVLVNEASWFYNSTPASGVANFAHVNGEEGEWYYADGITRAWNGSSYWTYGGVPSPELEF